MKSFWDIYWYAAKPAGKDRAFTVERVMRDDLERAICGGAWTFAQAAMLEKKVDSVRAEWVGGLDNVYRVFTMPKSTRIEVVCLGLDSTDSEAEGFYQSVDELPQWMQERLAVLYLIKVDPPQTKIDGVGMRVDENVFWIIKG